MAGRPGTTSGAGDLHGLMRVLGAGLVVTDDDQVTGLLMLLDERVTGWPVSSRDPEGERVRVSWRQPDTVGPAPRWSQRPVRCSQRLVLCQVLWVHARRVVRSVVLCAW